MYLEGKLAIILSQNEWKLNGFIRKSRDVFLYVNLNLAGYQYIVRNVIKGYLTTYKSTYIFKKNR